MRCGLSAPEPTGRKACARAVRLSGGYRHWLRYGCRHAAPLSLIRSSTTKFWGRGLGMAEVMGITKGHQGAIIVESEVGKGTTVECCFRLWKKAAGPAFRSWT